MNLARLVFILVVVTGFMVHLKFHPQLGRFIMLGGAVGLMGLFATRSFLHLKRRHTVVVARPAAGEPEGVDVGVGVGVGVDVGVDVEQPVTPDRRPG